MILRNYEPHLSRLTRFFMAPDGNTGGGGDVPAVVIDAPPADAPPVDPDLANFEPPDIGDAFDIIAGKAPKEPVIPTPATPTPKPAGDKPPEPKKGDAPVAQLRKEYDAIKAKLDEAEGKLKAGDPRIKSLEEQLAAKEGEMTETRKQLSDYEKKLALANPAVTKPLRDLDEARHARSAKFYSRIPSLDNARVTGFVEDYAKLPFGKPEFAAARAEFDAKVNSTLGGNEDREHRNLNAALEFIEDEFDYWSKRSEVQQQVNSNALKLAKEAESADFTGRREFVKTHLAAAKAVPDDLAKSNPFHPRAVVHAFLSAIGDEKAAEFKAGLEEFVELGIAGIPPRSESDFANMTPAQVREMQDADQARHGKAREYMVDAAYNGALAYRILPALYKDWLRLKEKTKDDTAAPDPTGGAGAGESNADSLADFQAPDLNSINFGGGGA